MIFRCLFIGLFFCISACGEVYLPRQTVSGYADLRGTRHYYEFTGRGDTLLILHGGPGLSHQYLKPQLDSLLGPYFTLFYYDQRGSGWSDGAADSTQLKMNALVQDLEALRNKFRLEKLNLLGHSFGGLLAMHYAIAYPEQVESMVLVDPDAASYALRTPHQVATINARLSTTQEAFLDSLEQTPGFASFDPNTYEQYYRVFLTTYFANPSNVKKLHLGFDSISVPKITRTNQLIRADLGTYDIHQNLTKVPSKTLVMQGAKSVFSVAGAQAITEALPRAELHVFEESGHFEYLEEPEKFKRLILKFHN